MSLAYTFDYELSEDLAARVADAFVRSRFRHAPLDAKFWKAMALLLVCAVASGAMLALGYTVELPLPILVVPAAFLGLFGGVLALATSAIVAARLIQGPSRWLIRRRMLAGLPAPLERKVRWTFTDDGFHVRSANNDRQIPWQDLRSFIADPEFLFLSIKKGPDLVLPVENLSNEVKDLLRAKAASSLVPAGQTSDRLVDRVPADPEQGSTPAIQGMWPRQTRKTPLARFLVVTVWIAGMIFLLQKIGLIDPNVAFGNLVVMGALAVGFSFSIVSLIKRAAAR